MKKKNVINLIKYYAEKNDYSEINSVVIFEFKRPDRNITYEEFSKQMR